MLGLELGIGDGMERMIRSDESCPVWAMHGKNERDENYVIGNGKRKERERMKRCRWNMKSDRNGKKM